MNKKKIVSQKLPDGDLNKIPEISLFKPFYLKYTPFAIDSVYLPFDTNVSFGTESSIVLSPIGDLISKTYLEVTLPAISFKRSSTSTTNSTAYKTSLLNLKKIKAFASINRNAFISLNDIFNAGNITNPSFIVSAVNTVFNDVSATLIIQDFKSVLLTQQTYLYSEIALQDIVNNIDIETSTKLDFYNQATYGMNKLTIVQKLFFDEMNRLKLLVEEDTNENIKFAWVDNIGHAIIKHIEVLVNGKTIDKHTGEWMHIKSELTQPKNKKGLLDKLIGNLPILTTFDRNSKPEYKLLIPLHFWFCNDYTSAFPIIALKSNQVSLKVSFRKIEEVSYIENNEMIYRGLGKESISLADAPETMKINISSRLLVDYVYLTDNERLKFMRRKYEYMINTVQQITINNIIDQKISVNLNPFSGVNSAFLWTAQKISQRSNDYGFTKTNFTGFAKNNNNGNPIKYSSILFDNYYRSPRLEYTYYNYVVPIECYDSSPADGINMFSFSLHSNSIQPSGHCIVGNNIKRQMLHIEFDEELTSQTNKNKLSEKYVLNIYSQKINIIRIKDGFHHLTFN